MTPPELSRVACHEAAHVVAAYLCRRPIESVSIIGDAESAGRAVVGTLRDSGLDEAITDIAVRLVGDIAAGQHPTPAILDDHCDEASALGLALAVARDALEAAAIVEHGRARARGLVHRTDFQACIRALWPVLLREQWLSGDRVTEILRGAGQ